MTMPLQPGPITEVERKITKIDDVTAEVSITSAQQFPKEYLLEQKALLERRIAADTQSIEGINEILEVFKPVGPEPIE